MKRVLACARQDGAGVGGVEDDQIRIPRPDAEGLPEGLRGETGAPHAEEHDPVISFLPDGGRASADLLPAGGHLFRAVQPAQAVGDFRGGWFPDRMVPPPDPGHDPFPLAMIEGGPDHLIVRASVKTQLHHTILKRPYPGQRSPVS